MRAPLKKDMRSYEWVPLVLDEVRETPSLRDNHMRAQIDFLAKGDKLFVFEQGLDPVFRWIDGVTDSKPSPPVERLKVSIDAKPEVDDISRKLIEAFYEQDVVLHREMQAGRCVY